MSVIPTFLQNLYNVTLSSLYYRIGGNTNPDAAQALKKAGRTGRILPLRRLSDVSSLAHPQVKSFTVVNPGAPAKDSVIRSRIRGRFKDMVSVVFDKREYEVRTQYRVGAVNHHHISEPRTISESERNKLRSHEIYSEKVLEQYNVTITQFSNPADYLYWLRRSSTPEEFIRRMKLAPAAMIYPDIMTDPSDPQKAFMHLLSKKEAGLVTLTGKPFCFMMPDLQPFFEMLQTESLDDLFRGINFSTIRDVPHLESAISTIMDRYRKMKEELYIPQMFYLSNGTGVEIPLAENLLSTMETAIEKERELVYASAVQRMSAQLQIVKNIPEMAVGVDPENDPFLVLDPKKTKGQGKLVYRDVAQNVLDTWLPDISREVVVDKEVSPEVLKYNIGAVDYARTHFERSTLTPRGAWSERDAATLTPPEEEKESNLGLIAAAAAAAYFGYRAYTG